MKPTNTPWKDDAAGHARGLHGRMLDSGATSGVGSGVLSLLEGVDAKALQCLRPLRRACPSDCHVYTVLS